MTYNVFSGTLNPTQSINPKFQPFQRYDWGLKTRMGHTTMITPRSGVFCHP